MLEAAARFQHDAAATGFDDLVAAPRAGAVGGVHLLADTQTTHPFEVMTVVAVDLAALAEGVDVDKCRRRPRRETSRAGAQDLNADLMRENKPSCGGVTCSPRSAANCTSSSASSAVSRVGTST